MSAYRRLCVPGGTYYFSACLADPRSDLLVQEVKLLRMAVCLTQKRLPFAIRAAVVLPNRLAMIVTLPQDDRAFAARWGLVKSTFSRHVTGPRQLSTGFQGKGEKGIWERRYWEHPIRDAADYTHHHQMIENAPVASGLVQSPSDWPYSSLSHRARQKQIAA